MSRSAPLHPLELRTGNRLLRVVWGMTWRFLYRPSPRILHGWRCWLLRRFGARIGHGARPYPRARIWAPWNLSMGAHSCMADDVDCYAVARIEIGEYATVSQYSYLCAATHDFRDAALPLMVAPICIGAEVWVAADVFVGPGVTIGEGAVVGARSTVLRDVESWSVQAGSPVRRIGERPRTARRGPAQASSVAAVSPP
jgi:putative colanic acid biosynthesis acetyltransferase WcaF